MPIACGGIWKNIGVNITPQMILFPCDAINTPVQGDLCKVVGNQMEFIDTGETAAIAAICISGPNPDGAINNPGFHDQTYERFGAVNFGGRAPSFPLNTTDIMKRFEAVTTSMTWVMTVLGEVEVTQGLSYGITRDGAGLQVINPSDTTNLSVRVTAPFEPDILATGDIYPYPAYWVVAVNPGGWLP